MKTIFINQRAGAIALLGAAALLSGPIFAPAAQAQGPQGGFGGPGGGPGGFGGPGGGGFNRRPPFAFGTVSAVDAGAGTITVASRFGGGSQTIQTQGTTQIVTQTAAAVSDLKKGDTIEVQGVPTGITASSVTIGQSPLNGIGGGPGGPPPGIPGGGASASGTIPATASATAKGTVTSTSPLTISLSSTASLVLKMDANAKVTKYATVPLSSIKVGDRVMSLGTANDDGSFAATTVAVNMDMGAMGGRGGFGGGGYGGRNRRGGGGFGGPGGGGGFGGPGGGGPGGMPMNGTGNSPSGDFGGPGGPPNQ